MTAPALDTIFIYMLLSPSGHPVTLSQGNALPEKQVFWDISKFIAS